MNNRGGGREYLTETTSFRHSDKKPKGRKRNETGGIKASRLSLVESDKRENPYIGSTPTIPQRIVKPDANGVYSFSPNAAAFKWNWNLLDVERGKDVKNSEYMVTPTGAFTSFRQDFDITPGAQTPSRGKSPKFPNTGKTAKRVVLNKIVYSPGGSKEGKLAESYLEEKRYDRNTNHYERKMVGSSQQGSEHYYKNSEKRQKKGLNEPTILSRDALVRNQSAAKCVTYTHTTKNQSYLVYKATLYNDTIIHADICTATIHTIYSMMYFTSVLLVLPEKQYKPSFMRRLSGINIGDTHIKLSWLIMLIIWISLAMVESVRFMYLFNRRKKFVQNDYVGNMGKSISLGFRSSAAATSIISVASFILSAGMCFGFVLYHRFDEEWSELKSLFWAIGLIHSGIVSSSLTRQLLFNYFPSTRVVAHEDPIFLRICFNIASIVPAFAGWSLMHIFVLQYMPIDIVERSYESIWLRIMDFFTYGGYLYTTVWWLVTCGLTIAVFDMLDLSIKVSSDLYTGYIDYKLLTTEAGIDITSMVGKVIDQIKMHGTMIGFDWWQIPLVLFQTLFC